MKETDELFSFFFFSKGTDLTEGSFFLPVTFLRKQSRVLCNFVAILQLAYRNINISLKASLKL